MAILQATRRDPHLRRVTGWFEAVPEEFDGYRPERTDRPELMLGISIGDRFDIIDFLVDTGADSTVLAPKHAHQILGAQFSAIDFRRDRHRLTFVGIGGRERSVVRPATYSLKADDGRWLEFYAPICIAEPILDRERPDGQSFENWNAPSLLGRDILRFFELHLDYHPQSLLELWYDEAAARDEVERLNRWFDYLNDHPA